MSYVNRANPKNIVMAHRHTLALMAAHLIGRNGKVLLP